MNSSSANTELLFQVFLTPNLRVREVVDEPVGEQGRMPAEQNLEVLLVSLHVRLRRLEVIPGEESYE